jgi:2-dehydro-3-deoxygalactonokinase
VSQLILSCDWGTSSFRLRLVDAASLRVLRELETGHGVDRLRAHGERTGARGGPATGEGPTGDARFRSYLAERVEALLASETGPGVSQKEIPVWISGMASSSIGWRELPYAEVPFPLDATAARVEALGPLGRACPHPVFLVSGLRTRRDVLRGEETQALGILAPPARRRYLESAVLLLPGTHSKHLRVREGSIVEFSTFLTGELFDLLCRHSILRHSVTGESALQGAREAALDETSESVFRAGVRAGGSRPLLEALFSVRARQLLDGVSPADNALYLSGLLVGSELGSLLPGGPPPAGPGPRRPPGDAAAPLILAAAAPLERPYRTALDELGLLEETEVLDPAELALATPRGHALIAQARDSRATS